MIQIQQLDHVALTVADIDKSIAWYRDVLGLERLHEEAWGSNPAVMGAGMTGVALFAASRPQPAPDKSRTRIMRHFAFRVDLANFSEARNMLAKRNIPFTFEDHTISHSIYLHDPDGYEVEITTYEI